MPRKITKTAPPYTSEYPELQKFLDEHGQFCQWQLPLGPLGAGMQPAAYIECWQFKDGRQAIVQVWAAHGGWNIFTDANTGAIDATLLDARERLGIK